MNFKSLYQKGRKKDGNKRLNEKTVVNYLEQRAIEGPESGTVKKQRLGTCFSNFFQKFCNIYRKTPVSESLFNNVAGLQIPTQVLLCEYCHFV